MAESPPESDLTPPREPSAPADPVRARPAFVLGDVFGEGVRTLLANPGPVGVYLVVHVVMNLLALDMWPPPGHGPAPAPRAAVLLPVVALLGGLSFYFAMGLVRVGLTAPPETTADWRVLWVPPGLAAQVVVIWLLAGAAIFFGFVAFVVPGVILALMWSQAIYVIIDGRGAWIDALRLSRRLTRGAKWRLLGAYLVVGFVFGAPGVALNALGEALRARAEVAPVWTESFTALGMVWQGGVTAFGLFAGVAIYRRLKANAGIG